MADMTLAQIADRLDEAMQEDDCLCDYCIKTRSYIAAIRSIDAIKPTPISELFSKSFYVRHDHKYSGIEIYNWLKEQEKVNETNPDEV